jgi:hypothetical protein
VSAPLEILSRLLWIRDTAALPGEVLTDQLGLEPRALAGLLKAHPERFSEALVFHLTADERQNLPQAPVLAFTEAGVALLTGLLPGKEAALLALLPAFAEARHILTAQAELSARVSALEQKLDVVLKSLQAEAEDTPRERPIGFVTEEDLPHGLKAKQRSSKKG